ALGTQPQRDKPFTASVTNSIPFGSNYAPNTGRPKTVCTEYDKQLAAETFVQGPKKSSRRASLELYFTISHHANPEIWLFESLSSLFHGLLEDYPQAAAILYDYAEQN
ncbi:hypothetical protein NPIL_135471, partial [Nephila pilipes]